MPLHPVISNGGYAAGLAAALAVSMHLLAVPPALAGPAPPVPCPAGICAPGVPLPQPPATPIPTPAPSPSAWPPPLPRPPEPLPPLTPEAYLQGFGRWVFAGGSWTVCLLPDQLGLPVEPQVCPPEQSVLIRLPEPEDWFAPLYRRMVQLAGLLMLPMLLLALLQALLRGDAGLALRSAFGYAPLAVVLSAVAVALTQALLRVTDSFSDFMLEGYQAQVAGTIGSLAGVLAAGGAGVAFTGGVSAAAVVAAVIAILAALAIFFELLIRQALIYAAVLFLPLGFAAMVWPRLLHWAQRLVEVLVAAILAKFVIVSVLVLGAAAYTAAPGGGPFDGQAPAGSTLIVGLLLVGLAALSPFALFWALPTFEAAVLAQFHGLAQRPLATAPHLVQGTVHHLALRGALRQRGAGGPAFRFGPGTTVIVRQPPYGQPRGGERRPPPSPPPSDTQRSVAVAGRRMGA